MSARDLLLRVAASMKKTEADFKKYIDVLEENFIDTVDAMRDVSDEQWRNDLAFPVGLINKIKKELEQTDVPMEEEPVKLIDTKMVIPVVNSKAENE